MVGEGLDTWTINKEVKEWRDKSIVSIPSESVNAGKQFVQQFQTSVYATENPIVGVLQSMQPAVLPQPSSSQ